MSLESKMSANTRGEEDKEQPEALKACVRVRPFVPSEKARAAKEGDLCPCLEKNGPSLSVVDPKNAKGSPSGSPAGGHGVSKDSTFTFDEVFWSCATTIDHQLAAIHQEDLPPPATQSDVFDTIGASTLTSVIAGYNACIFAYGQTGSGKSHSIIGTDTDPGLSPRILAALFEGLEAIKKRDQYMNYTVDLAVIEIYNEKPSDLLNICRNSGNHVGAGNGSSAGGSTHRRTLSSDSGFGATHRRTVSTESGFSFGVTNSELDLTALDHTHGTLGASTTGDSPQEKSLRPSSVCSVGSDQDDSPYSGPRPETPETARAGAVSPAVEEENSSKKRAGGKTRAVSIDHGHGGSGGDGLRVRQHPQYGVYLQGLHREAIDNEESARARLHKALNHRTTASTKMNDQSSRSHAMIQLVIHQESRLRGTSKNSCLNIIDLAGSERIKLSGVAGAHLTEAKNINLSLTTLRRVIDTMLENQARSEKNQMKPPYRDALLTHLLSDSLGGNSKTTMLATVSPHKDYLEDTLSSLRYASRARSIICKVRINKTQVQTTMSEVQGEVDSLKRQITTLEESDLSTVTLPQLRQTNTKKTHVNAMVAKINRKKRDADEVLREQVAMQATEVDQVTDRLQFLESCDVAAKDASKETLEIQEDVKVRKEKLEKNEEHLKKAAGQQREAQAIIDEIMADPDFEVKYAQRRALERKIWRSKFINAAREIKDREETTIVEAQRKILKERNRELKEHDGQCDAQIESFEDMKTIRKIQIRINDVALQQVDAYDCQKEINESTMNLAAVLREKKSVQSDVGREFSKEAQERDNLQVAQTLAGAVIAEEERLDQLFKDRIVQLDKKVDELKKTTQEMDSQFGRTKRPDQREVLELQVAGENLDWELLQIHPTIAPLDLEVKIALEELAQVEADISEASEEMARIEADMVRVSREMTTIKADYDTLAVTKVANVEQKPFSRQVSVAGSSSPIRGGSSELQPPLPGVPSSTKGNTATTTRPGWNGSTNTTGARSRSRSPMERSTSSASASPKLSSPPGTTVKKHRSTTTSLDQVATVGKPLPMFLSSTPLTLRSKKTGRLSGECNGEAESKGRTSSPVPIQPLAN